MDFPMPTPAQLQNGVLEFLRAGDHYRAAYRAAFAFRAERVVPELTAPGFITATGADPLHAHLARLVNIPACVRVAGSGGPGEAMARCLKHLKACPGDTLIAPPAVRSRPDCPTRFLVDTPAGQVALSRSGTGDNPALFVLHGAGGSSATVARIIRALAADRPVLAMDLPGHGESDYDIGDTGSTLDVCTVAVEQVLAALGLKAVDVLGIQAGALIAHQLAGRKGSPVRRAWLVDVPNLDPQQIDAFRMLGMPSLAPDWFGGHLLQCWHMVRDGRLFFPWFQRDPSAILWSAPDLDDQGIQLEVTEYLKADGAWQTLLSDQLNYPLIDRWSASRVAAVLCAAPGSLWHDMTRRAAEQCGLPFQPLPEDPAEWGSLIAP
jgi:pimeloyl-ACP methyl ester carboxylesterase